MLQKRVCRCQSYLHHAPADKYTFAGCLHNLDMEQNSARLNYQWYHDGLENNWYNKTRNCPDITILNSPIGHNHGHWSWWWTVMVKVTVMAMVMVFTARKIFKPNFTSRKVTKLQQFWHFNWTIPTTKDNFEEKMLTALSNYTEIVPKFCKSFQKKQDIKTSRLNHWGKPQTWILHVQTAFCQIAFQPPAPQANGRFVAGIFRRKWANSLKQRFWSQEWIFWQ